MMAPGIKSGLAGLIGQNRRRVDLRAAVLPAGRARVIVTSGSDGKIERVIQLGATDGINSRTPLEWDRTVRELSGGSGVDLVVEAGGAD